MFSGPFQIILVAVFVGAVVTAIGQVANSAHNAVMGAGALVAKEFAVKEEGPVYARVVGRRSGLLAFLLSLLGIDPTTTLEVRKNGIELTVSSLSGRVSTMIPLSAVCNVGAGYQKPIGMLVVAIFLTVVALGSFFSGGPIAFVGSFALLVAIILVIAYYLNKTLSIFVIPMSNLGDGFRIKRSVIEGVNVDEQTAYRMIEVIASLIEEAAMKK